MANEHLLAQRRDGVLNLTLNQPEKLNALSDQMIAGLLGHVEGAHLFGGRIANDIVLDCRVCHERNLRVDLVGVLLSNRRFLIRRYAARSERNKREEGDVVTYHDAATRQEMFR